MTDQILWFASRGSGVVSLVLLTGVVCLGILTVVRWQSPSWPRFLSAGFHRNLALLAVAFLGVHVVTAILDPYWSLGLVAALIPFSSTYRPVWVGLGVIAHDLVLAIVATSLLRGRLGARAWRAIHWLTYAAWPLALVHGWGSGTDAWSPWLVAIQLGCAAAVAAAVAWRLRAGGSNRARLAGIVEAAGRGRPATRPAPVPVAPPSTDLGGWDR